MKLSIITINRNNAAGLEKTMLSVAAQTFKEFEYVVVDGASTDGSVEVIKKLEPGFAHLKWVSEPDKGIYNAMNKGMKKKQPAVYSVYFPKTSAVNSMSCGENLRTVRQEKLVLQRSSTGCSRCFLITHEKVYHGRNTASRRNKCSKGMKNISPNLTKLLS